MLVSPRRPEVPLVSMKIPTRLRSLGSPAILAHLVVLCALVLGSTRAEAQVFVSPRRAQKSQVRHFKFEWRHIDIFVGSEADTRRDQLLRDAASDAGVPLDHDTAAVGASDAG